MSQRATLEGWRAHYDVSAKGHWFVDVAKSLDDESVGTVWARATGHSYLVMSFNSADKTDVASVLKGLRKSVKLIAPPEQGEPEGVVAFVEFADDKDQLLSTLARFPGRVTLYADPEKTPNARIIVESPVAAGLSNRKSLEAFGETINALPDVKLLSKPQIQRVMLETEEFVDLNDARSSEALIDERDIRVATELINAGHYDSLKKERPTLEEIAKRAGMTKPTLIRRMRRLEGLGIDAILGGRIPKDVLNRAAEALGDSVRPKKR